MQKRTPCSPAGFGALANNVASPDCIAVLNGTVYFASSGLGRQAVQKVATTGGTVSIILANTSGTALAIDGTGIFLAVSTAEGLRYERSHQPGYREAVMGMRLAASCGNVGLLAGLGAVESSGRPMTPRSTPTNRTSSRPSQDRTMTPGACVAVSVAACLVWAALATGAGSEARADRPDPSAAEELIRQANDLRRSGHDERAVPLLRKAYEVARSARTAGQLGLVDMALGYWAAAEGHLEEALAETRNPWIEKTRAVLESALRAAQSHLAELRVEGMPDGAEVVVNGSVVGTLPLASPLRVSEGRVVLEVRAPGRRTMTQTLLLAGKTTERVQVSLARLETASATLPSGDSQSLSGQRAPDARDPDARDPGVREGEGPHRDSGGDDALPTWRRVVPWAILGGAVVSGSVGVWQQLKSSNAQNSFDSIAACGAVSTNRGSDPRCAGLYSDFQSGRNRAYIGYGVAGVLGAGAIAVFILNATSSPGSAASSARDGHATVALDPDRAVFSYSGRF